jgi:CRP/FNR family transcriptional regulator, cyclic AMP receptor protein
MRWAIFDGLAPEDRDEALGFCRPTRHRRGDTVFLQGDFGDALYLIESGRVLVQIATRDADIATVAVLGPGSVFGEQALVSASDRRIASIVAVEPLELLKLSRTDFERLRVSHPSVDRFLFAIIARQTADLTEQLLEALYVPAETRVILRLARVADAYGAGSATVSIPLTQEQIASIAGTTRPTVNRVLRSAAAAGALRLGRGRVDIVDRKRLIALAG